MPATTTTMTTPLHAAASGPPGPGMAAPDSAFAMATPPVTAAPSAGGHGMAERIAHAMSEPLAHALVQWPALVALLQRGLLRGQGDWVSGLLGAWLLLVLATAYRRGGLGFGNVMVAALPAVAGAWWLHPSPWAYAVVAGLAVLLLAAQRLNVQRALGG